jgi:hypothetical protein
MPLPRPPSSSTMLLRLLGRDLREWRAGCHRTEGKLYGVSASILSHRNTVASSRQCAATRSAAAARHCMADSPCHRVTLDDRLSASPIRRPYTGVYQRAALKWSRYTRTTTCVPSATFPQKQADAAAPAFEVMSGSAHASQNLLMLLPTHRTHRPNADG